MSTNPYADAVATVIRLGLEIEADDATAEAAKVAANAKRWEQARICWEQVQAGAKRRDLAKDISVGRTTVDRWVLMWGSKIAEGGRGLRDLGDFTEAYSVIRGRPAMVEEFGSQRGSEAAGTVRNLPTAKRAEIVREALEDPEVAKAVVAEPESRRQLGQAAAALPVSQQLQDARAEKAANMPSKADQKANEAAFNEGFVEPTMKALSALRSPLAYIDSAIEEFEEFIAKSWEIQNYDKCVSAIHELITQAVTYGMLHDLDVSNLTQARKLLDGE